MKLIKVFCMLLLLLIPAAYAITASIGNAKMILRPEVIAGKATVIERTIKVNNVNDVPVNINLYTSGDIVDIVELYDENFTLQPGETKDAKFVITLQYGGKYEGKINVKFTPLGGGQGVGLSSTIIILAEGPENPNPDIEPVGNTTIDTNNTGGDNTGNNQTGTGVHIGVGGNPDQNQQNSNNNNQSATPTGGLTFPSAKSIVPIMVGIIIIMTIVAVGMAAYLLLSKK